MTSIHEVLQIVNLLLEDVAENPARLQRAQEIAQKQITTAMEAQAKAQEVAK